ncbi:hypothetical protein [Spirosoma sp. KNUC1025]|uniref:hypothetical protein n=1 Tax=Spirosoma sp. KNUC1025 TaxID=2894082 RepID=UPI001E3FCD2A|nr:hypothetical protein [Spirosoma sp. KNUC1025]UFH57582.1 hypothetical protein LN737_31250 [Spirosoma sp. KNUC1025]
MKTFLYGALLLLLFTPIYGQPKATGLTDLDQKRKAINKPLNARWMPSSLVGTIMILVT